MMLDKSKSKIDILYNTVLKLLRKGYKRNLRHLLEKVHPADVAALLSRFEEFERKSLVNLISNDKFLAEVLSYISSKEVLADVIHALDYSRIAAIFHNLDPDDAADIIGVLPEEERLAILELIKKEDREEVNELLKYDPNTAGGIMDPNFLAVNKNLTVEEAIQQLRGAKDIDMVFYIYVIDDDNKLVGVLSLRQLILAPENTKVAAIMNENVISVTTSTDQEEVAKIVSKYDLLAVPVVDEEGRLVGMVTVDDVIDVIREEATEDILKMAGTTAVDITNISTIDYLKARLPWLLVCFVGGLISSRVVNHFQNIIAHLIALAAFMPLVNGMSGNVGSQSSSIIVRSLAMGKIDLSQTFKVIFRELRVGMLMGVLYGFLLGVAVYLLYPGVTIHFPLVVSTSMMVDMTVSATMGAIVPLTFERFGIDPALASGPFVTTIMDMIGVTIYFTVASLLLSL